MRITTALSSGLAAVGLAAGLLVAPMARPVWAQDAVASCLAEDGIYLYVFDQSEQLVEGCTHGATGMARLSELAEVKTSGSFICQVAGRPEICETPMGDLPYWSYWWWRDGAWQYATIGGSYPGEPGTVEAWHFASGVEPPLTPEVGTSTAQPSTAAGTTATSPSASAEATGQASTPGIDEPQEDAAQAWLPTAVTVGVLGLAGLGYALWRRSRRPR